MLDTTNLSNIYNKQGGTYLGGTPSVKAANSGGDYTSMPSWMTGGYRNWYTGSPDYTNEPMNQYAANQGWWRSPSVAGGLLYNNYYGYQDANAVRAKYLSAGGPVSNADFTSQKWFTPQTNQDWKTYYPDRNTDQGWLAAGYHWDGSNWVQGGSGGGGALNVAGHNLTLTPGQPTNTIGGGTQSGGSQSGIPTDYNTGSFSNYPQEWNTASNTLSYLAQNGGRTPDPSQWYDATNVANQMAYDGMPTDVSPWYTQAKQQTQYDIADAIKQANEQSGVSGTRWSSVNNRNAQDIGARAMTTLGTNYAQQTMSAQEAARARQQSAVNQLQSLGASSAGLTENATNRAQSSADALGGIGNYFAQYPLQVSQQGYNMGQSLQATDQAALDKQYSEFQRLASENNPWFKSLMSMVTSQGTPTQYTPGGLTSILSGLC